MSQPLTTTEFEIPQRSGEVLCLPPATTFLDLAQHNARVLAASPLRLGGQPLEEVRRRTRRWVLEAAAGYTRALKIPVGHPSEEALLLATGHQPFLFHPGVWIKHLLISRLASDRVIALSIPVDSDALEEIGIDVPSLIDGLQIVRETLFRAPPDVPYEAHARPPEDGWRQFLDRVAAHLRKLSQHDLQEVFGRFIEQAKSIESAADLGTFFTVARRRYEGTRRYLEFPVSRLAHSQEFRQFFFHILRDCARFADCFNRHLDAYRLRNNIRTAAQPFPNLEVGGNRVELPFWILHEGRRRACFAQALGRGWRLWADSEPVGTVSDTAHDDEVAELEIRPRAMTLTAFTRLCVADLFIHGVGGGHYDRATDEVIRDYFEIEPPQYAVVTATLHLPLAAFNTSEERQLLQRRLLELRHNPERVLRAPSQRERELIDEKWRLIAALETGALTRRARRQATQRIREINDLLTRVLEEERLTTERRLADLATVGQAAGAATHRGYPFCFFPPEAVDDLVTSVLPP